MDLISLSIPIFFLLIGVELIVSRVRGRGLYRLHDSLTDLGTGIINQVISVFTAGALLGLYWLTWEHLRLLEIPRGAWWGWVLAVVGVDLGYYWFHRMSHEHNVLWVTHVVHHQSEDYNFSVALRQGAVEPLATWLFYQPLALLGVHPLVFATVSALNTLYQFWVHTQAVDRLGPLEAVLNTPSHHRVHHGCDPRYLDRNYGGMFIVWDRLFGTYQVEEEPPTYGVVKQLASWNPVWANLEHPLRLVRAMRGRGVRGALRLWWEPPAALPSEGLPVAGRGRYDVAVSPVRDAAAVAVFVLGIGGLLAMLFGGESATLQRLLGLGGFVVCAMLATGAMIERRAWTPIALVVATGFGAFAAIG